ncbi:hypothetical protein [Achromobacter spanius]|uniref:Uncharacterized protein n=1 Tax=Achromobacter spanius TaxID=217203 RepID=A0AAW3I5U2_9BURK|nr:hypothetical protein [Achromobacter spanius]KNE28181.1 hypothetical protein AFM18_08425 [Achromobacter spanius]
MTENNAAQPGLTDDEIEAVRRALEIYAECYDTMTRIAAREGREPVASPVSVAFDIRKNMVNAVVNALSKLRAEGVQAGEPVADERCKRCGGPGWYTSHTTGYPESIPCSACNPQGVSVEQLAKDPFLAAQLWRKSADAEGSPLERILEHVSEYGESMVSSTLLSVRSIARRNVETRIAAELAALASAPVVGEQSVTSILLEVVPGDDGMGHEVYATSVEDVKRHINVLDEELEEWELGIRRLPASAPVADERETWNTGDDDLDMALNMAGVPGDAAIAQMDAVERLKARLASAPVSGEAHTDDANDAFGDFADQYLTDGNGYAPVSTFKACGEAFNKEWPNREAAFAAAKTEYDRLHPRACAAPQASEADATRQAIKTCGSKVIKALADIARADGPDTRKSDDQELIYRSPVMDEVARIRQAYDELERALKTQADKVGGPTEAQCKEAAAIARSFGGRAMADVLDGGDCAKGAGDGQQKYWLCCGSKDPNHPNRRAPDCFNATRAKWGTADQHSVVKQSLTATQTGEKGESDA